MISPIPNELIYRTDLTLMERAIIPLVIARTLGWATRTDGVSVPELQATLGGDLRQLTRGLHDLCGKGILQQNRRKEAGEVTILYGLNASLVEHINAPVSNTVLPAVPVSAPALSNQFIDMPNDRYVLLNQNAIDFMVKAGYDDPSSIFSDYVDECRSNNPKSMDWDAHFRTWLRNKTFRKSNVPVNTKYVALPDSLKPDPEQFKAAEYFYHRHTQINKGFAVPNNMQYEGYQIRLIVTTTNYDLKDVVRCIDWLFSPKGDWYRPNVTSCEKLREKFDFIYGHTVSFAHAPSAIPDGVNLLDELKETE
ncbi:hypothetical protein ACXWTF_12760 [Thiomicrolovo sp. ZZH C-3]